MILKILMLFLSITLTIHSYAEDKKISYHCKGLSHFEIMGSPGSKEEMKEVTYTFINESLQDLNNIECHWDEKKITCESNFLNIRRLIINLENLEVSDFISGNKGFGQYAENFNASCTLE